MIDLAIFALNLTKKFIGFANKLRVIKFPPNFLLIEALALSRMVFIFTKKSRLYVSI